jgi:hypothetical protein
MENFQEFVSIITPDDERFEDATLKIAQIQQVLGQLQTLKPEEIRALVVSVEMKKAEDSYCTMAGAIGDIATTMEAAINILIHQSEQIEAMEKLKSNPSIN